VGAAVLSGDGARPSPLRTAAPTFKNVQSPVAGSGKRGLRYMEFGKQGFEVML
jgi:hypothetical protein